MNTLTNLSILENQESVKLSQKYLEICSNYLSTITNALKTYHSLYSIKQETYLVNKTHTLYGLLKTELIKQTSPPILQIPTHKGLVAVYSCSIKASMLESFEQTVCHISAYIYPYYEKIDIIYKD